MSNKEVLLAYTGIGSRSTPEYVLLQMERCGRLLAELGYTLRSGGADGADKAFEKGANAAGGATEIYLPWRNFNGHKSNLCTISKEATALAATIHPAWDRCSQGAKALHARNCYQVLGADLNAPSEFLVCWTPDGIAQGGTATAINLAIKHGIKVINLGKEKEIEERIDSLVARQSLEKLL